MKAFITAICWNNICQFRISRAVFWSTGYRNTLSGILYQDAEWFMAIAEQRGDGATRQTSGSGHAAANQAIRQCSDGWRARCGTRIDHAAMWTCWIGCGNVV